MPVIIISRVFIERLATVGSRKVAAAAGEPKRDGQQFLSVPSTVSGYGKFQVRRVFQPIGSRVKSARACQVIKILVAQFKFISRIAAEGLIAESARTWAARRRIWDFIVPFIIFRPRWAHCSSAFIERFCIERIGDRSLATHDTSVLDRLWMDYLNVKPLRSGTGAGFCGKFYFPFMATRLIAPGSRHFINRERVCLSPKCP
jgi:hypothetical protein